MDLYEAMRCAPTPRRFKPDAVPQAVLERALEYARFAPSGGNRQGWRVIVGTAYAVILDRAERGDVEVDRRTSSADGKLRHDTRGRRGLTAHEGTVYSMRLITFAGRPTATENGSRSRVTTLLAPITQRSPI